MISYSKVFKVFFLCHISTTQLVTTMTSICMDSSSNSILFTSLHLICVSLATRLLDSKKLSKNIIFLKKYYYKFKISRI